MPKSFFAYPQMPSLFWSQYNSSSSSEHFMRHRPEVHNHVYQRSTSINLACSSKYPMYPRIIQAWLEAFRPTSFSFLIIIKAGSSCRYQKKSLPHVHKAFKRQPHCLCCVSLENPSEEFLTRILLSLYHMDTIGHKIKNCWFLKHKIQDLMDAKVIRIDLSNQKYEISITLRFNHPNPPKYSYEMPFIIRNPGRDF